MPSTTLLTGTKVVDMTTVLLGPYCTQTLADLGAEVTKIEPPFGDVIRLVSKPAKTSKMSPTHLTLNRGKRCVDWDPKSEQGHEATVRLLKQADVFIHNIRTPAIERLGLSYEKVKAINPGIVYVHAMGFSADGPYADRPAYDDIIQALSGMTSLTERVDGSDERKFLPMAIADKVSGLHAVYATLGGLLHRDKTGDGIHIEVPMLECVTSFLLAEHFDAATMDPPTGTFGYERQLDPTRQPIKTADGWVVIAPYSDDRWIRCLEVLGASQELKTDLLSSPELRRKNRSYLQQCLSRYANRFATAELLKLLDEADIPAAPAHSLEQLQSDPHLLQTNFFQRRSHPTECAYWEIQPPVRFHGLNQETIRPAREIGQDTELVLQELGLSARVYEEIDG